MKEYNYLECYVGNSCKFYEAIRNEDNSIDVWYGRIGTSGQRHHYEPYEKDYWKLIREKENKGYKVLQNNRTINSPNPTPRKGMGYEIHISGVKKRILDTITAVLSAFTDTVPSQDSILSVSTYNNAIHGFTYAVSEDFQVDVRLLNGNMEVYIVELNGDSDYQSHRVLVEELINHDNELDFYQGELNRFLDDKKELSTMQAIFA